MKYYAISRWKLTGKSFESTFGFSTADEAKVFAKANSEKYQDQYFVKVIQK